MHLAKCGYILPILLIIGQLPVLVSCANILFYFAKTGFSHLHSVSPLINSLVRNRGHNVTILIPVKLKAQISKTDLVINNLTIVTVPKLLAKNLTMEQQQLFSRYKSIHICKHVLTSRKTSALIYRTRFDLVIFDMWLNDGCAVGLAYYKFKAPYIGYSTTTLFASHPDTYGLPLETATISDLVSAHDARRPLTIYQKITSTLVHLKYTYYRWRWYNPALEEILQEELDLEERPSLADLHGDTSLVLMNTYFGTDYARSLPPAFIPVGGMLMDDMGDPDPLPEDLRLFLEDSHRYDGFVYVSFGSELRSSKLGSNLKEKFLGVMKSLANLQFVWKLDLDHENRAKNMQRISRNIYYSSWLPQRVLFAHPSIKGAIVHGGMNSFSEAVHFGIPLIVLPVMSDNEYNANVAVWNGFGIKLNVKSFTQSELKGAIQEMCSNGSRNRIRAAAKRASKQFRDRPLPALETAVWWVEYVLRHRNTSHLGSMMRSCTWYEKRLLDVWISIFLAVNMILVLTCWIFGKFFRFIYPILC